MNKAPEKNNNKFWKTKYGPRRVRHDPPTLEEAFFAAQGLSDDPQAQIAIAASLMELPLEEVKAKVGKMRTPRKETSRIAFTGSAGFERAVVVEKRPSRRVIARR